MTMTRRLAATVVALVASIAALTLTVTAQQSLAVPGIHAKAFGRLLIRNAMVIYGSGRPRAWIRDIKDRGADGLEIIAVDRDQLEAILDEANRLRAEG